MRRIAVTVLGWLGVWRVLGFAVDRGTRAMDRRYDYDSSSMRFMYEASQPAFWRFLLLMVPASHRSVVPAEAHFATKIVGAMTEDCGPCTQLVVNMALEARVAPDQLEAVLARRPDAMTAATRTGWRFATAIAWRTDDEDAAREAVRAAWGDAGLVELSMALAVGRVFPMTKAGLGYARECRLVRVEGRHVPVAHGEPAAARVAEGPIVA